MSICSHSFLHVVEQCSSGNDLSVKCHFVIAVKSIRAGLHVGGRMVQARRLTGARN